MISLGRINILNELPRWLSGKESTSECERHGRRGFNPWVRRIPWRRKWQPTPVFTPGESHGQRSLVAYSPGCCKELDTAEHMCTQRLNIIVCLTLEHNVCAQSLQSCQTLGDTMDCNPPGSSVHGILQAKILEWVVMPSSRGSSRPRDWTQVSFVFCIAGGFFTAEPLGKPLNTVYLFISVFDFFY